MTSGSGSVSSEIRWRKPPRAKSAAIGAAGLAAAGILYFLGHGVLSALAALAGAIGAGVALERTGEAACPNCGEPLDVVIECQCPACLRWFQADGDALRELDDGYAAELPRFAAAFPHGPVRLPPLCCACGAPATRSLLLRQNIPESRGPGLAKMNAFEMQMPYCASHKDGASVESAFRPKRSRGAKDAPGLPDTFLALKVKSYGFYRAYLLANP